MRRFAAIILFLVLAVPAATDTRLRDTVPITDNTFSLGSASLRWQNVSFINELRAYDDTYCVGFKAPTLGASQIWTLPTADGAAGETLITSGAGILSWSNAAGGGAPFGSPYVTIGNVADLTAERALTIHADGNLTGADAGANSTYTLNTIQGIKTTSSPTFAGLNLGTGLLDTVWKIRGAAASNLSIDTVAATGMYLNYFTGASINFGTGASGVSGAYTCSTGMLGIAGGLRVGSATAPTVAGLGVGTAPLGAGQIACTARITSTLATGTSPLAVTSTTENTNLNAQLWGGNDSAAAVAQGDILYGSAAGVVSNLTKSTTAGQFLSNSGTSNNPAWATPALTALTSLYTDYGDHGTGANTTEVTLASYSLPASTLAAGKRLTIHVKGLCTSAVGNATLYLYFGSDVIASIGSTAIISSTHAEYRAEVYCKGATDNEIYTLMSSTGTLTTVPKSVQNTDNVTGAILIKVTGLTGSSADDEVTCEFFQVGPVIQ